MGCDYDGDRQYLYRQYSLEQSNPALRCSRNRRDDRYDEISGKLAGEPEAERLYYPQRKHLREPEDAVYPDYLAGQPGMGLRADLFLRHKLPERRSEKCSERVYQV